MTTQPTTLSPAAPVASQVPHDVGPIIPPAIVPAIRPVRVMLDSDALGDLPAGLAPLLGTYADLITSPAELAALRQHHAGSQLVFFDRGLGDPLGIASIVDREDGAVPLGQLAPKFRSMHERGIAFPTCYSDRNDLAACDAELAAAGFDQHWRMVATLDGTAWLDLPGYTPLHRPAVIQCLPAAMTGIHADLSLVLNPGWHPTP